MSGRNSEGNYSFSRDVLLFICTYKLFARSSQFEGENIHDDSIVVVVVVRFFVFVVDVVVVVFFVFFRFSLTTPSSPKAEKPCILQKNCVSCSPLVLKVPYIILDSSL